MGGHRNADGDGRCAPRVERLPPERALDQPCTEDTAYRASLRFARAMRIRKRLGLVRVDQSALTARELASDPCDAASAHRIATLLLALPPAPEVHRQQDVHTEDVNDRDDEVHRPHTIGPGAR